MSARIESTKPNREPLDLRVEPNDEAKRLALAIGSFSGLYLSDARGTLAAKLDSPGSAEISKVVENSPAHFGGLEVGDIVLEVEVAGAEPKAIMRPSEWRQIEDRKLVESVLDGMRAPDGIRRPRKRRGK